MSKKYKIDMISNGPKIDKEAYGPTTSAIQSALSNRSNKNIGIIGDFGSGKTSAIETFCRTNFLTFNPFKRRKIVKVSLAEFCDLKDPSSMELQSNIIQQILYSTKKRKIPKSNYVKRGFTYGAFFLTVLFLVFGISLFYCLKHDLFNWLKFEFSDYFWFIPFASGLLFIILLPFVINFKSIKAKLNDVEIEADLKNEKEPFDKYLDEIVYFFSKTHVNLVIFEDIDRCKDCDVIFTKLRLLNTILNNVPRCCARKNIVFMHAVKEDIFKDYEQKSKYFDVLIPVKPIFSKNSAFDHFKNLVRDAGSLFSEDFIEKVANKFVYMRQMNNVVNAFKLISLSFEKPLEMHQNEKLFSVILYKSVFPEDYIQAIKGKGILCYLRSKKSGEVSNATYGEYEGSPYFVEEKEIAEIKKTPNNTEILTSMKSKRIKEFKEFYSDFSKWLNVDAFNLIAVFPNDIYSKQDKLFIRSLPNDLNRNNIKYKFDDPKQVILDSVVLKYISYESCCNISLFFALFENDDLKKEQESFMKSFKDVTEIRAKFINSIFVEYIKSNDQEKGIIISFLSRTSSIAKFFDLINKNSLESVKLLAKILSKDNFSFQNQGNDFLAYLCTSQDALIVLSEMSDEMFNHIILQSGFKLSHLGKEKQLLYLLDNKASKLLNAKFFEINKKNLVYISEYLNDESPTKSVLTNIYNQSKEFLISILNQCKLKSIDIFTLCEDYSGEDEIAILTILKDNNYSNEGVENLLRTCRVLKYDSTVFNKDLFFSFIVANKIQFSLNHLGEVWDLFTDDQHSNLIESIIKVNENLRKEELNEKGTKLLSLVLNDKRCVYELAGKVMQKTIATKSLDSVLIKENNASFKVALQFGYFVLDDNLLEAVIKNKELYDLFKSGKYVDDLQKADKVFALDADLALYIAKQIDNDEQRKEFLVKYYEIAFNPKNDFKELISEENLSLFPKRCILFYIKNKNIFSSVGEMLFLKYQDLVDKSFAEDCVKLHLGSDSKFYLENDDFSQTLRAKLRGSKVIKCISGDKRISFKKVN